MKSFLFFIFILYYISTSLAMIENKYDFDSTDEIVGQVPLDMEASSVTGTSGSSTFTITNISPISGNNSALFSDNDGTVNLKVQFKTQEKNDYDRDEIYIGHVNFSFNDTQNNRFDVKLFNKTVQVMQLRLDSGIIYFYNGSYRQIGTFSNNIINNMSIYFNTSQQNFTVILNNTILISNQSNNVIPYQNNITGGISEIDFTGGSITGNPIFRIDNLIFYIDYIASNNTNSYYLLPTLDNVRKFPYPYKAMLTISSDIDDASPNELYTYLDYFNTNHTIPGIGVGLDLEMGQNWYNCDGYALCSTGNPGYNPGFPDSVKEDYLKRGYLDGFHSIPILNTNMGVSSDVTNISNYFDYLKSINATTTNEWNHEGTTLGTNLGVNTGLSGDTLYNGAKPSDISNYSLGLYKNKTNLRYYWQGRYNERLFYYYPLVPQQMQDGNMLFRIQSKNIGIPPLVGNIWNREFSQSITDANLKQLVRKNGYSILANHLFYGMTTGTGSDQHVEVYPFFDSNALSNLSNLKINYTDTKKILVTSDSKLLNYAEVSEFINIDYNTSTNIINIINVSSPVRTFVPTVLDLMGITIYTINSNQPTVMINGVDFTSSTIMNPVDETGKYSVMFPWIRGNYPYPSISSVGNYTVNSNNIITWDNTSQRPSISQSINLTIIPSSGSLNISMILWENNQKIWTESATNTSITSLHVIGDFPPNSNINVKIDGISQAILISNSTGYISFIYTGGYSSHTFDISLATQALTTLRSVCTQNSNTYGIILQVFSIGIMILAFGFIVLQIRSIGEDTQINPASIVTSIIVGIIGFAMLIFGNYLIYAIMGATGC